MYFYPLKKLKLQAKETYLFTTTNVFLPIKKTKITSQRNLFIYHNTNPTTPPETEEKNLLYMALYVVNEQKSFTKHYEIAYQ